ncbi:PPR domain-containing protein/PPR_2 domain-containing protein, partial [Cephalotus follicularis]
TQNRRRLDTALRVLDIITPKPTITTSRHRHLLLIQDFLRTGSNHSNARNFEDDFAKINPTKDGVAVVHDIIESFSVLSEENSHYDASVLSTAVSFCGSTRNLRSGVQYHCLTVTTGFIASVYVGSSLISFYGRCGELSNAYKLFEEMPIRNVVTWTAIIAGFAQAWLVNECLELYRMMGNSDLKPNDITFVSILSACTVSGALGQGRSAHCQTIRMGFDSYVHIANALVSMYCKCANLEDAFYIFNTTCGKDIVSWNSMIAGYAQHGLASQAIDLFEEMKKQRVKPDAITFLAVLSSCRHAGLVDQGKVYFDSMVEYGVKPKQDHYSCIVDLLGRAGLLTEAQDFIGKMPIHPNAVIWGSLLSSCRLHGSVWIGIQAAESRLLLEPECAATHVQLANLYASVRCWGQAAEVRKMMKDKGLKTNPGFSWIEIKNEVNRFRAEDRSNTKVIQIVAVLDCLVEHMRPLGYVPEMHDEELYDTL